MDVRVLVATNKNMEEAVKNGQFRYGSEFGVRFPIFYFELGWKASSDLQVGESKG